MADKKKDEQDVAPGVKPVRPKTTRQTIQVAKELVATAKKVAVLCGETLDQYARVALTECASEVEKEIITIGPLGVRDRSEGLDLSSVPKGTFNTDPKIATRLNMLAGQCLTSVAKLIHPHLKKRIDADFSTVGGRWSVPTQESTWEGPQAVAPPPISESPDSFREFMVKRMTSAGYRAVIVTSDSLSKYDIKPGDLLMLITYRQPMPGDTVVLLEKGQLTLRTVQDPLVRLKAKSVAGLPPLISIGDAKDQMLGILFNVLRFQQPNLGERTVMRTRKM